MTPKEFLEIELKLVADKFHNINIKYGFDDMIDCHIVELTPIREFYNNKELDNEWIPLSLKFMELYKTEEIAFISSDSTLSLKEVIFEFNTSPCSEEDIISELFAPLTEQEFNYDFPTNIPNGKIMDNAFLSLPRECVKIFKDEESDFMANAYPEAA